MVMRFAPGNTVLMRQLSAGDWFQNRSLACVNTFHRSDVKQGYSDLCITCSDSRGSWQILLGPERSAEYTSPTIAIVSVRPSPFKRFHPPGVKAPFSSVQSAVREHDVM